MPAELDWLYVRMRPVAALRRLITHVCFQGRQPTMRWLWLNALYDRCFRAIANHYPIAGEVCKPIFILGVGRSGTTILGKLLSFHPAVGFLNEPKALWHVICPEEDILGTYPASRRKYRLGASDVDQEVRKRARRLYGAYLKLVGAQRVVDKYPEAIYRIPFLLTLFGDTKLVLVLRNGAETVRSIAEYARKHAKYGKNGREDWWGINDLKWRLLVEQVAAYDPLFSGHVGDLHRLVRHDDRAAVEWILAVREAERWLQTLPSATIHLVRYEHLVIEPKRVLEELLDFCELPFDASLVRYAQAVLRQPNRCLTWPTLTSWVEDALRQVMLSHRYITEHGS